MKSLKALISKKTIHRAHAKEKSLLEEWDIVQVSFSNSLYLYVKDPELLSKLGIPEIYIDDGGVFLYFAGEFASILYLYKYDKELKHVSDPKWDIKRVYRNIEGGLNIHSIKDLKKSTQSRVLNNLCNNEYTLVFSR